MLSDVTFQEVNVWRMKEALNDSGYECKGKTLCHRKMIERVNKSERK